jgi:hypothetical protein
VFRFQKDKVLQVGSSFSRQDCTELVEACADIVGKLEVHGGFVELLLGLLQHLNPIAIFFVLLQRGT